MKRSLCALGATLTLLVGAATAQPSPSTPPTEEAIGGTGEDRTEPSCP